MSDDDIIRIDGVEYEYCHRRKAYCGWEDISIRPKRTQTGWICRGCGTVARCIIDYPEGCEHKPGRCLFVNGDLDWQPFYGKVVE